MRKILVADRADHIFSNLFHSSGPVTTNSHHRRFDEVARRQKQIVQYLIDSTTIRFIEVSKPICLISDAFLYGNEHHKISVGERGLDFRPELSEECRIDFAADLHRENRMGVGVKW